MPELVLSPIDYSPPTLDWQVDNQDAYLWIDARSPAEHENGALVDSVSLPLLENEERALVGTLYKNLGRTPALEKGYELVNPKIAILNARIKELHHQAQSLGKKLAVFCARGGLRSRSIAYLIHQNGFGVHQLKGGYKAFRAAQRAFFAQLSFPAGLWLLYGHTGAGKTSLLSKIPNSLNLEGLAEHRGSLFGGFGRTPVTQKWFEAFLIQALSKLDFHKPILMEGESSKIGPVLIPNELWQLMQNAPKIQLLTPLPLRTERIMSEYLAHPAYLEQVPQNIRLLKNLVGKEKMGLYLDWCEQKEYYKLVESLLADYYDLKYQHSQNKYTFLAKFSGEDLVQAALDITTYLKVQQDKPH